MIVFKKNFYIIGIIIIFLLTFVSCNKKNPKIETVISLSNITEDEYITVKENNALDDITIDDFKKLYINIKIINSKDAIERTINIPDLFIIDNYDDARSSKGASNKVNNIGSEDMAESTSYIIFNSKGLSENIIRKIYENEEIYVSYRLKGQKRIEERISIGKNLELQN